jgi:hypothetical protein
MFSSDHEQINRQIGESTVRPLDTIVILLSCQKAADRRDACHETFLSHGLPDGMKVVFLVGRPGQEPALCADVLYLDCSDQYEDLPEKTWAGIRECLLRWDFKWLFKADDDTFCNLDRIKNYVKSRDYFGRKPEWTPQRKRVPWHVGRSKYEENQDAAATWIPYDTVEWTTTRADWAGGGTGYFLSNRAARLVAREPRSHVARESYEDKFVADVMASYGILLYGQHPTLRTIPTLNRRATSFENMHGATTLHPLAPDEMRYVYWELLRSGDLGT